MLRANWMLIGFWGLCFGISLVLIVLEHIPAAAAVSTVLLSTLVYVVPEWVNIRALRSTMTARNSALTRQPKSI
jgi:hypothetical protein